MNEQIVFSFVLLFCAVLALICAVYVALIKRNKLSNELKHYKNNQQ